MGDPLFTEDKTRPGVVLTPDGQPIARETAKKIAPAQYAASFPEETATPDPPASRIARTSPDQLASLAAGLPPVDGAAPASNIPAGSKRVDLSAPVTSAMQAQKQAAASPAAAPAADPGATIDPNADPLQGPIDQIRALRQQPQMVRTGNGVRTQTTTQGMAPDAREDALSLGADIAIQDEMANVAREEQAKAQAAGADRMAEIAAQQARELEQQRADAEADRLANERRMAQETEKLQSLTEKARTEIDPERWWRDKGTPRTIMAALSMAMGQFATAFTGGPNTAAQIIDTAIGRDIDAQLANRQGAREAAADQRGFMSLLQGQYDDRTQARQNGMIVGRELAAAQIEQISQQTNSKVVQEKAAELSAQMRAQNQRERQQLMIQTAPQQSVTAVQTPGGVAPSNAARQAAALEAMTFAPYDQKTFIPGAASVIGQPVVAATEAEAKELRDGLANYQKLLTNISKLEAIGQSGSKLSPQDRQTAAALYSDSITTLNQVKKLGVLAGPDLDLLIKQLGPMPTDWVAFSNGMPNFRSTLQSGVRAQLANKTYRVNPDTVPLAMRARFQQTGGGGSPARPTTEKLGQ